MPTYEYRCTHCGGRTELRRSMAEMDAPADSLCCGQPLERQFTPTRNIHIPIHSRAVLTGGEPGGAQYSWSDFHDMSEREMAHAKDEQGRPIEYMKYEEAMSRPGYGRDRSPKKTKESVDA